MKPSKKIIDMEKKIALHLDSWFPKSATKSEDILRTRVMVLIIMAKELGVQGHADILKQRRNMKGSGTNES